MPINYFECFVWKCLPFLFLLKKILSCCFFRLRKPLLFCAHTIRSPALLSRPGRGLYHTYGHIYLLWLSKAFKRERAADVGCLLRPDSVDSVCVDGACMFQCSSRGAAWLWNYLSVRSEASSQGWAWAQACPRDVSIRPSPMMILSFCPCSCFCMSSRYPGQRTSSAFVQQVPWTASWPLAWLCQVWRACFLACAL